MDYLIIRPQEVRIAALGAKYYLIDINYIRDYTIIQILIGNNSYPIPRTIIYKFMDSNKHLLEYVDNKTMILLPFCFILKNKNKIL